MRINADFDKRVVMHADEIEWLDSPMAGVTRRPLDRIGDEVARATTIVRYAPNSAFSAHVHGGGEEFIVLDGVFSDEHGDFPEGSYIRNPPTSSHTPRSEPGATIFVKLWQFDPDDRQHVRLDMGAVEPVHDNARPGVEIRQLFQDERETVRLESWEAFTEGEIVAAGGAELLILEGTASERGDPLRAQSWVRVPDGDKLQIKAGPDGVRFWLKIGHLRYVSAPGACEENS